LLEWFPDKEHFTDYALKKGSGYVEGQRSIVF